MPMIGRPRGKGGGTISAPVDDPAIVRYKAVPTLSATGTEGATPGDLRRLDDGYTYRMKAGTTDASDPDNWERERSVPRRFLDEADREARTSFTPAVGETVGIVGINQKYTILEAADADQDVPFTDDEVSTSNSYPAITSDSKLHIQTIPGAPPRIWYPTADVGEAGRAWAERPRLSTRTLIEFMPNGTIDFSVNFTLANVIDQPSQLTDTGYVQGSTFAQPKADTNKVQIYTDSPDNILAIQAVGIASVPVGLENLNSLSELDFSGAGLTGTFPYIGALLYLTDLDISNNPALTAEESAWADNPGLTVVGAS